MKDYFFVCDNLHIYSYEGSYLFTIESETLADNDWLMVYAFASGLYGTLLYYANDTTGSTFIFYDTQINVASCWEFTLAALDGTTFIFDVSEDGNSVSGIELIDNDYGEIFTPSDSDNKEFEKKVNAKRVYLQRKAKRTHKISYDKKDIEKSSNVLSEIFGKHNPLQSPLTMTNKRKRNAYSAHMANARVPFGL